MDQPQSSSVREALAAVPDPRHARGQQVAWRMIVGLIASALVCQQRSMAAMTQWVHAHHATLLAACRPRRNRLPSDATLRRALRSIDLAALEQHLATPALPAPPPFPTPDVAAGAAGDGTYARGAGTHGAPTLLVSLVHHASAQVLAQPAVPDTHQESRGVAALLTGRDVRGLVITLDAGLTHPALAAQIRAQGGHSFMVVKRTQARLYQELTW